MTTATPKPPRRAIDARLRAVERLIEIFRLERYVYLTISLLSFLVLSAFAVYLFVNSDWQEQNQLFLLLFVPPAGASLYASGAFLKMWTQAVAVLGAEENDD